MSADPLPRLSAALRDALSSVHSSFYRTLYAPLDLPDEFPSSSTDWERLPFLTKEALVRTPLTDRLFVPFEHAHSIRMSSGTSGRGVVLIPRNFHVDRSYYVGKFTTMLSFYIPHFGMDEACEPLALGHIGAIPDDLPATARMAALSQTDALAGAVSPILAFAPELSKTYDGARIRYIHLWGERPSPAQFDELTHHFPNAVLTWEYSNIETGGQSGRACETLASLKDDRVHPLAERYYWELVDTDGRTITDTGTEGEIVLTTLWPGNAFPALRFRTGDLARRCAPACACSAETFQILGRVMFDRAVIPGGELKSEELERVLEPFSHDIAGNFELHVTADPHPSLTLYVESRHPDVSFAHIREHLLAHLRISATQTLGDALARGLVGDLAIARRPDTERKVRRIVKEELPPAR